MIATDRLTVSYHGRTVLSETTLTAQPGRVLALVGPSGCGKSSFLLALNQLTDMIPGATTSGRVLFGGRPIETAFASLPELRRHVGMIFQKPNPFPMSIRRNIELALKEHGIRSRQERQQLTEKVLRDVGLWDEINGRLDDSALTLSGGQQQRLCIARSLALQPRVLLMDEPCSALDPIATATIESLIASLRETYTVIIVTHNLAQAGRVSDELAVFWTLDGVGRVIEHGPTERIFDTPSHKTAAAYLAGRQG